MDMTDSAGRLFAELLEIMRRLRSPDGCPWDREQTRASLKAYLIEEAYEVLEALDADDPSALAEELGDLLLQVVFHAQVAAELGEFAMADVLRRLVDKLVTRHPHVFGDTRVGTPAEALAQWEAIKSRQAPAVRGRRSVLDGVPRALPALLRAQRLASKAARVQFDWPDATAAWEKVEEEMRETADALASGDRTRLREEIGDALFALVNVARLSGIDAEDALQGANEKFRGRFTAMEADLAARGTSVHEAPPEELEQAWEATKARERSSAARERTR
jgi:tetrapyrrole methylase family protein / MazG family protein